MNKFSIYNNSKANRVKIIVLILTDEIISFNWSIILVTLSVI
jgi:hypothetical protein